MGETITGKALFDRRCAGRSAAMLQRRPAALFLPCIAAHQLALCNYVPFHRAIQFGTLRVTPQIKHAIECEDFEKVAMRSGGRARTAIASFAEVIRSLHRSAGEISLTHVRQFRIDIPDEPMGEESARRIRIIDNQHQTLRAWRNFCETKRGMSVRPVAGELRWNVPAFRKCCARDFHFGVFDGRLRLALRISGQSDDEHACEKADRLRSKFHSPGIISLRGDGASNTHFQFTATPRIIFPS
jgi:hypothetical protein